jgi:hypothetical protein
MKSADTSVAERGRPSGDSGTSLVEILVAIVLLGTAVLATLTALRGSIIGTAVERDHAKAYQWLQSSVGVLKATERVGCDLAPEDTAYSTGEEKVRLTYQQIIRDQVVNPPGWADYQLKVIQPVEVWDGTRYWDPAVAPQSCYDSAGFKLQLLKIEVTSPSGKIIEQLEVVKDGSKNG